MSDEYDPDPTDEYWPGEWVPRDEIEPNDWNPNEMSDDQRERLRQSLLDNGWTQPVVVHAEDRYIVDGEQRWSVAGHEDVIDADITPPDQPADAVPVYGITINEGQAKIATVQHNKARGELTAAGMKDYLGKLDENDILDNVLDRIGVDKDNAQKLLDDVTAPELVGTQIDDFGHPWEPVERHERSEEEMDEDRSESMRDAIDGDSDADSETAEDSERLNYVVTEGEKELIAEALGTEHQAQSLVNLADYAIANGFVPMLRDDVYADMEKAMDADAVTDPASSDPDVDGRLEEEIIEEFEEARERQFG